MTIKKALSATLFAPLLAAVISGCSDSSSSSSNVSFYVQAGQEDIEDALVRVIAVTEGGQLDQDAEGRLSGNEYITDEDGSVNPSGVIEEVYYFELVGQSEDNDTGNDPTRVRCQWADGCEADSNSYSFGTDITRTDNLGWRAIAYGLDDNERVRLTPLTDLAAQLAYDYLYDEATPGWQSTGYYSPYSVEQAISQVSQIFGIDSIESREPADLTELSGWAAESGPAAVYSIRYGALIAAWNHLAEGYSGDFTRDVAEEFSANEGQMPEDGSGVLTLNALYSAALSNLQQIETEQGISGAALTTVINDLTQEIADFSVTLTNQTPAPLQDLFGADDLDDFQLGIRRAKAFVEVMRNYQDTFFEEGYRDTIDGYMDMLKAIGDEHEDDFNTIINRYVDIKDLYLDTYLGNTGVCASTSVYAWMASASCQYDSASDTLTLTDSTGMNISVTQRVADVNTTDEDDTPSQSHAMDVLITGRYQVGGLTFLVDNTYEDDDPDEDIVSPTGIRIYYTDEVSQLADSSSNEIIGYELRWSDFAFYQADLPDVINGTDITQDDVEISGSFRIFYRGVRDPLDDPQNPVTDLRFNIDTVVLNGRVSDVIGDDNDDDNDYTTVYVAASAANASDYYPEDEWSSFNGFFNPTDGYSAGAVAPGLVEYERGTETIGGQSVDYLDIRLTAEGIALEDSARYRFYPTVQREDESDVDRDDDTDELVNTHDIEICELGYDSEWAVTSCDPKQRLYGERDTDQAINDLWEAGAFSRVTVPGRGTYFVSWNATPDAQGCYALDPVTSGTLDGTLYEPMVLGLNLARLTVQTVFEDDENTALDVLVNARTEDRYTLTAALSHDYSSLTSNGDIYYGTGSDLDRIMLSYDTDSNYAVTGNLAVFKDGVSLTLDPGTAREETDVVDSSLGLYINRHYTTSRLPYRYVTDDQGNYDICVTENAAEATTPTLEGSVYYLNFRDVVYGSIRNENGAWIIRYIDGSFESL